MDQTKTNGVYILGYPRLESQLEYINKDLILCENIQGFFHIVTDSSLHHQTIDLMNFQLNNQETLIKNIRACLKQADLWCTNHDSIGIHFEYFSNKKWWMIRKCTTINDMIYDEKKIIIRLRLLHTKKEY